MKDLFKKIIRTVRRKYRMYILRDEKILAAQRWRTDHGDYTLRLNYTDLSESSVVFDVGGYLGDFAYEIHKKYGCKVFVFEPHPKFFSQCTERFEGIQGVKVFNYGLGAMDGGFELSDSTDGSSFFNSNQEDVDKIYCEVRNINTVMSHLCLDEIDLMKINIEGAEYDLLDQMSRSSVLDAVKYYQIQFHDFVEDASARRDHLRAALSCSHRCEWCYPFVWEGWKRK